MLEGGGGHRTLFSMLTFLLGYVVLGSTLKGTSTGTGNSKAAIQANVQKYDKDTHFASYSIELTASIHSPVWDPFTTEFLRQYVLVSIQQCVDAMFSRSVIPWCDSIHCHALGTCIVIVSHIHVPYALIRLIEASMYVWLYCPLPGSTPGHIIPNLYRENNSR